MAEEDPLLEPEGMFLQSGDEVAVDIAVLALSPGMEVLVYNIPEEGAPAPGSLRMRVEITEKTTLTLTPDKS